MKMKTAHTFSKLLILVCLVWGYSPTLSAQADFVGNVQPGPLTTDASFTVTIALQSSNQLIDAAEVHLTFDPSALQVTNLSIAGTNQLTSPFVSPVFDNTIGTIDYSAGVQTPPAIPVTANFDFLVIEFDALQLGTTTLNYVDPNPPIAFTVAFLAGVDVLNEPNPIDLTIVGSNGDPVADFTATPNPAETDQIISFNASTSTDPDDDLLAYDWVFGDGTTGSGQTIDHAYTGADTYNVVLTVDDGNGGSDTANVQVVVTTPTVTSYTITPTAGPGGSISPDVPTPVLAGGDQTFTITPDSGYEVEDVLVGGISVGAVTSFEFTDVQANASINATFSLINVDTAPEITLAATAMVAEGGSLSVPLSITDADGDILTVTYASISNEPQLLQTTNAGKQVDPFPFDADGFFTQAAPTASPGSYATDLNFLPVFGDGGGANGDGNGIYTITVTVEDEDNNIITKDLVLTVNDTPQFISEASTTRIEAESFDNQGPPYSGTGNNGIGVEVDNGFTNIGYTHVGNFMEFEINVETAGLYDFNMFVSDPGADGVLTAKTMAISSSLGGSTTFTMQGTGSYATYVVQTINVNLQAGPQTLRFEWTGGGGFLFNMDYMDIDFIGAPNNPPTIDAIADVEVKENEVINIPITVNDDTDTSASIVIYDKSINTAGNNVNTNPYTSGGTIAGYTFLESPSGSGNYVLSFASGIPDSRSYFARITANDGVNPEVTQTFIIDVAHPVSNVAATPSVLDATTFSDPLPWYGNNPQAPFSVSIENSGTNIGYIEAGEFVEYLIDVPAAGLYDVQFTSANGSTSATDISIFEEGNAVALGSVTVPNNGWSSYADFTVTVAFANGGLQTLRLDFAGGVNTQKLEFSPSTLNTAPVVAIMAPASGIALTTGTSLDFSGTANDFQDGDLSSAISWSSDLDGPLGTGGNISASLTTVGTHTITAEATDNDAAPLTGTAIINLVVTATDPSCDARFRVNAGGPILLADSANYEADQATSAAGGTAQAGTPSSYVDVTAPAVDNTYGSTTALVSNDTGYPDFLFQTERWSDAANPDNMNWTFPTGNGVFDVKILFNENWTGEGGSPRVFDVEIEGDIALDDYRPSVDGTQINIAKVEMYQATVVDGFLNVNFVKGTQNPSVKGFDICYVSDLPNEEPIVEITAPTNGANVVRGADILLTATANDDEDGDISDTIEWLSSDTEFDTDVTNNVGASVNGQFVKPGPQTLTAAVTDSDGAPATAVITVNMSSPGVVITAPNEGADLNSTTVSVTVDPTNVLFDNTEHFHFYINPPDINNLDSEKRISTVGSAATTFEFDENSGSLAKDGAGNGIVEGSNTILVFIADKDHVQFPNAEAMDMVSFTVTLPDTTPPTITCPGDIVVDNDTGVCGAAVAFSAPVGEDDLPGAITTQIAGLSSGAVFPIGETTVTFEVEDAAGNKEQCSFTVTVNDMEAPSAVCSDTTIQLNASGTATINANVLGSASSDVCGIASISASKTVFSTTDLGENTITLTVTDLSGNQSTCTSIVTVEAASVGSSQLTVLDANTDEPLFDLVDGMIIKKSEIGNTPLGIIYNTDFNPNGVLFTLTGPINENRNEGPAPHSLFGDIGIDIQGKPFPIGNYTLVANPNSGPTITVKFEVTDVDPACENFNLEVSSESNPTTCDSSDGEIVMMTTGSTALPVTYSWSHDANLTGNTATGLEAGTYSVTASDGAGCSETVTITLEGPLLPVVTLSPFANVLESTPSFALTGGLPAGGTYNGQGVTNSTFDPSIGPGNYSITYTFTDGNGCSNSASRNILVTSETANAALIVLDATDDTELFALTDGLQIDKNAIGETPLGVIYNTNLNPTGVFFTLTGPINESRNEGPAPHSLFGDIGVNIIGKPFPVGDYQLIANPKNGPTITVNFAVVDEPSPCASMAVTVQSESDPTTCSGANGSITIAVNGATAPYDFDWSHDGNLNAASATGLSAGSYTVMVTDTNGCEKSVTVTLNDPAGPNVTLANLGTIMDTAAPITLSQGSPNGGMYSGTGVDSNAGTFDPSGLLGPIAITYSYTDSNGCSDSATKNIVVTTIDNTLSVLSFTLVDADTNEDLLTLVPGMQVDINSLPPSLNLNIRANTTDDVSSVSMVLTGSQTQSKVENVAPYALFGDSPVGEYYGNQFITGNYVISATPYSLNGAGGTAGTSLTIGFELRDLSSSSAKGVNEMEVSPNPTDRVAVINFDKPVKVNSIHVFDVIGRLVKTYKGDTELEVYSKHLGVQDLPAGTYFVRTTDVKGAKYQQQMAIKR